MNGSLLAINCSLTLRDRPPSERPSFARALGYDAVEFWWPFASQDPGPAEVREFVEPVLRAEVSTLLLNFPGGGVSVEDRGLLCVPGRQDEFTLAAERAVRIGRMLGATLFNPMAGNVARPWNADSKEFDVAVENLVRASQIVGHASGTIVLEPLSGFPRAAIQTYAHARELAVAARERGAANVRVLLDLYHAAMNDDPILRDLDVDLDLVGHVQIADMPGRGWPGSGGLPLGAWIRKLSDRGYLGRVGLECVGTPRRSVDAMEGPVRVRGGTDPRQSLTSYIRQD